MSAMDFQPHIRGDKPPSPPARGHIYAFARTGFDIVAAKGNACLNPRPLLSQGPASYIPLMGGVNLFSSEKSQI